MTEGFDLKRLPTELELKLKKGAQVMLLNNDPMRRWVNGSLGVVQSIGEETVAVDLEAGGRVEVGPYEWKIFHFKVNQRGELESETVASFVQLPLKLAWAVTIHKSQGKTFDRVIIDIGHGIFAHGQLYVALSRCRSLAGITLKKPIKKSHILLDWRVVKFVTGYQYLLANRECSPEDKSKIIAEAIKNGKKLKIVYLKRQDVRSERIIKPEEVGAFEYGGRVFPGVKAHCFERGEPRVFHLERILKVEEA